MSKEYVEQVDEACRVAGSRVSLDSIVYCLWNGDSPETIVQSFPVLTLEQVYGAVAYYLDHQDESDEYIKRGEQATMLSGKQLEKLTRCLSKDGRAPSADEDERLMKVRFQADADLKQAILSATLR